MADAPEVDFLYETPETGELRIDPGTGKSYRAKAQPAFGASLSGPSSPEAMGFTAVPGRGLGGSDTGSAGPIPTSYSPPTAAAVPIPRVKTAEELLAEAQAIEDDFIARTEEAKRPNQSYMEPFISQTRAKDGPPDWLMQYMESQPTGGTRQMGGPTNSTGRPSGVSTRFGKSMTEQERLRLLKANKT